MGKNHRHKKNLKSEKSKVKLKTFLPKGQNVSDLSFKIRPIVLPEQLRVKENEVLSSRKLSLKDILNRLNHYNVTVKCENCKQLKELICKESGEFLKQNLSNILSKLCPLILDKEPTVRREVVKVLNEILKASTSRDISSFFDILSSYLKCAMTHINQNIQEDSLSLLDALLLHVPNLVAQNSHKLLIDFFTLISKLKSNSNNARTLAQNLKSKYTGIKWRIQVLIRLKKILEAIHNQNLIRHESCHPHPRYIDATKTRFAPIYFDKYDNYSKPVNKIESNNAENLGNYIDTLTPLLNETWLEVAPSNDVVTLGEINATPLREESANTLHCLLTIFYLLYHLAETVDKKNRSTLCSKFKNKTCSTMFNVMLQSFPYIQNQEMQQRRENGLVRNSKCVEENLLICYLFSIQNKNIKEKTATAYAEKILNYLNYCLLNRKYVEHDQTQLLCSIINVIVEKNQSYWRQSKLQINVFIENVLHYYLRNNQKLDDSETQLLFMLYDNIDSLSGKHQVMAEKFSNFMLSDKISSKMLDSLLLMVKKKSAPVQESVRNNLSLILGNIKNIQVGGIDMEQMKVIRILSLFNYVPLNDEDIKILQKFGDEHPDYNSFIDSIIVK